MNSRVLFERDEGGRRLSAVLGDMTEEKVDAIVNAANTFLDHGGGLAGAIVDRGGVAIQDESDLLSPIEVGSAVVTGAGSLPCRWVIHAVGPMWGEGDEEALLRSAVRSSLDRALELGARSLAMPAISTGIFGYPQEEGIEVIVSETRRWLGEHPHSPVAAIRFTAFDDDTVGHFATALRHTSPRSRVLSNS